MSKTAAEAKPKLVAKVTEYLKDTRGEVRKVSWPTRQEATKLTAIVLAVTAAMALFLGALDFLFANLVRLIIS